VLEEIHMWYIPDVTQEQTASISTDKLLQGVVVSNAAIKNKRERACFKQEVGISRTI
jgi:hypothetical protein